MIELELHGDNFSSYCGISQDQYKDIEWLSLITPETYLPIHEMIEGIKKGYDKLIEEKENNE